MSQTVTVTLDLKGLSCPLPIAKTAQAIRTLEAGAVIEATGNELVERTTADGVYRFVIRKV